MPTYEHRCKKCGEVFEHLARSHMRLMHGLTGLGRPVSAPLALLTLLVIVIGRAGDVQSYPVKPISLVVSSPTRAPADQVARALANVLAMGLSRRVIVENRAAHGGLAAADHVARSTADGHVLLAASDGLIGAMAVSNSPTVSARSFVFLAQIAAAPYVLVVNNSLNVEDARQLVERGRPMTFATQGPGTTSEFNTIRFARVTESQVIPVPYKGLTPVLADVLAGQIDGAIVPFGPVVQLIRDGQLKALAVLHGQRLAQLPDTPTLLELGYEQHFQYGWVGILAPDGMPPTTEVRLTNEIKKQICHANFSRWLLQKGWTPVALFRDDFARVFDRQLSNRRIILQTGGTGEPECPAGRCFSENYRDCRTDCDSCG